MATTLTCPDCGRTFQCQADEPTPCWCASYPPIMPVPGASSGEQCWCPCRLEREIAAKAAARAPVEHGP